MIAEGSKTAKPFVKWAGGKGALLPQLEQYFPPKFRNYYEPFFGGGAVFFRLLPTGQSHINDINDDLMVAYEHVRDDIEKLVTQLRALETSYKKLSEADRQAFYYERRAEYNEAKSGLRKTVLLIFLNRTCFNGLYRENSKGQFNVPFGRYANPTICDEANLRAVCQALQRTTVSSGSFVDAVASAGKGDFVYLDPPYVPLNATSSFTAYHETGFGPAEQERLRNLFVELDKRGCYIMLSNSAAPMVRELYQGYRQETILAGRAINSKATGRAKIEELVIVNY